MKRPYSARGGGIATLMVWYGSLWFTWMAWWYGLVWFTWVVCYRTLSSCC